MNAFGSAINSSIHTVGHYLNPFTYYTPQYVKTREFIEWMVKKIVSVTADHRYYPFTEVNPLMTWQDKLKLFFMVNPLKLKYSEILHF